MKHFKRFALNIYDEWKLPWQLIAGLVVLAGVTVAIGIPFMFAAGWIVLTLQGLQFESGLALEAGINVLYVLLGLIVVGGYLRNKWKETAPKVEENGNTA